MTKEQVESKRRKTKQEKKLPRSRKHYTDEYKHEMIKKANECKKGELAILLRIEGLCYSTLKRWCKQYEKETGNNMEKKIQNRKKKDPHPLEARIKQLTKENNELRRKLLKAEKIIEFQRNFAQLSNPEEL